MSADTMDINELSMLLSTSGVKTITGPINTVVCCNTEQTCTSAPTWELPNQQQENTMYDEFNETYNRTENERKAEYFQCELSNSMFRKRAELTETFKLDLQDRPTSPKEMVEWIKDGKFTFVKYGLNDDGSWREPNGHNPIYDMVDRYINWNNPDRDVTGYHAADKKLDDLLRKTERQITAAATPAEMLKYLEEFEATTIN